MNEDQAEIIEVASGDGVIETSANEVQALYDDLGVKAKPPVDKSDKRPKADAGGSSKTPKEDDAGEQPDGKQNADDGKNKSKASSSSDKSGKDGDDSDASSKESGAKSGKDGQEDEPLPKSAKTDEGGVQDSESGDDEEAGEASGQDSKEEDGKRPGKSNPGVERRFQKMTADLRTKDSQIEELNAKLTELMETQRQAKIEVEDPKYTIDDFRTVRDNQGQVLELDDDEAELAFRRWQDGYNQRSAERDAEANRQAEQARREQETSERLMRSSVEAYDTLTDIMEQYPELNGQSGRYDEAFAKQVMPVIHDAIQYQPGTEPGNPENRQPVILGFKMNPTVILNAIDGIRQAKRDLPINGMNDNVESRSNVRVAHERSSDEMVNQANELMRELGIKKKF